MRGNLRDHKGDHDRDRGATIETSLAPVFVTNPAWLGRGTFCNEP
jgi:hypothetical protein